MNRILSNCSIQVALKSCLAFRPVHKNQKTFAVYSIPCGDCENACSSLKEHQIAVSTFNKGKTEHMLCDIKHTIEWDDSKVITTNNNMAATTSYCNIRSNSMLVWKRWVVHECIQFDRALHSFIHYQISDEIGLYEAPM